MCDNVYKAGDYEYICIVNDLYSFLKLFKKFLCLISVYYTLICTYIYSSICNFTAIQIDTMKLFIEKAKRGSGKMAESETPDRNQ